MSYCRSSSGDSDVYVIGTRDELECFGAGWKLEQEKPVHDKIMVPDWSMEDDKPVKLETEHEFHDIFRTTSRHEMIDHLLKHREAGHIVPEYAIERLQEEIQEVGDSYV